MVAVSLLPLALASGYEEHGYGHGGGGGGGGGGDYGHDKYEAHVSVVKCSGIQLMCSDDDVMKYVAVTKCGSHV